MTTNKKILAIGGPFDFEWVDDYGWQFIAAIPSAPKMIFQEDPPNSIPALLDIPKVVYHTLSLGDPETQKVKKVYVVEGMTDKEAVDKLNRWLMRQFINMEE